MIDSWLFQVLSHRFFKTKCVTQFLKVDVSKARDRCATAQRQERSAFDHHPRVDGSPLESVPRKSVRGKALQERNARRRVFIAVFQNGQIVPQSFNTRRS